MMPIFCRQLRLRTESSKSVTGMLSTWPIRSRFFCGVLVVVLLVRGLGVLEEQCRPRVVGIDVQHPLVALRGLLVLLAVFVEQAEVHQRADVGGKAADGPLVQLHGRVVVAAAVVFQGQAEQGAGMVAVGLDGPLVEGHDLAGIAAQGGHGGAALVEILGRLLDGAGERIEHGQRGGRIAGIAEASARPKAQSPAS